MKLFLIFLIIATAVNARNSSEEDDEFIFEAHLIKKCNPNGSDSGPILECYWYDVWLSSVTGQIGENNCIDICNNKCHRMYQYTSGRCKRVGNKPYKKSKFLCQCKVCTKFCPQF
jgi:hypothetical protein